MQILYFLMHYQNLCRPFLRLAHSYESGSKHYSSFQWPLCVWNVSLSSFPRYCSLPAISIFCFKVVRINVLFFLYKYHKGIVNNSNFIFLWHELEGINKKFTKKWCFLKFQFQFHVYKLVMIMCIGTAL